MAGMSVGGLVSGLDTNSIIAQLTALEQAKVTREEKKKENAQKALEQFKELQTRLGNLATKASALESLSKFNVYKSTSSNEDYVTVSGKDGATAGQYAITVSQLATAQKVASNSFDAINKAMSELKDGNGNPLLSNGAKVTISLSTNAAVQKADPQKTTVDIEISSSDTLKDIVNKINLAEGSGVKASLMTMANGDNRLILTAVDTGTNGFYLKESAGTSLLSALGIVDYSKQKATSGSALTVIGGGPANLDTTFDQLNTVLNKNNLVAGDKIGIYLPKDDGSGSAGWKTFELFDGSGNPRTIEDVLKEINKDLEDNGADFEASLNSSGEIVLKGNLNDDQNFGSLWLNEVKIQIGTFDAPDGEIVQVKKDMGTLVYRRIFTNIINEGQNAFYTLDGMSITSQSNEDDKIVPGTVFNLKKVTDKLDVPVKVSLEMDKNAIADNITALVEEFNALMSFINENAKATVTEQVDKATGKKTSVREVGCFTGDSNISSLQENLKRMMTGLIGQLSNPATIEGSGGVREPNPNYNGYYTPYSSAASLGITTQRDGTITVDKDKLLKALDKDLEGVRRLFTSNSFSDTPGFSIGNFTKNSTTGTYKIAADGTVTVNGNPIKVSSITANIITLENGISIETPGLGKEAQVTFVRGIANQMTNFVEKAKTFKEGYYDTSEKTYQDRIDSIQKRVNELQVRVDRYNDRITKQFAALEKNMGNLQSQTANMLSALSTVSYSGK